MADISPELREARREYGRRGARARLLGTTLEERRELTAAATEARRTGTRRKTLADRIAETEAALPAMSAEERHRHIVWLAELRQSDQRLADLRQQRIRSDLDTLADELAS